MKKLNYLFIIFISFFVIMPFSIKASTNVFGYAVGSDVLFASKPNLTKPNNSCFSKTNRDVYAAPGKLHCLDSGDTIKILNYDSIISSTISNCKKGFYYASYTSTKGSTYNGYICADNVNTSVDSNKYKAEFEAAGIPSIYYDKLTLLKEAHPNWKFKAYNTGLDWNTVITNESVVGMSYIQSSNPIYLSLDSGSYNPLNNTYKEQETGGWFAANKATVAYYMDPRNFMDEKNIFMFENLGYNSTYQTESVVKTIFKNTDLLSYSSYFIEAATYNGNNVSPIMLAARSRQEVVTSGGKLSSSANGSKGYYNFYNLGAFSKCSNPVSCAIDFASGYNGAYTTFNRPWKDAKTAILNGANYIANGYINQKQNTLYFQKFNVTSNSYGNYSHQYMTNIMAPSSEAKSTQSSYASINGLLDSNIEFIIPVYNNMPSNASALPTSVDEDKKNDKKEEVITESIETIVNKAGYTLSGSYLMNVNIGTTAKQMLSKIKGTVKRDGVVITGDEAIGTADTITINSGSNSATYRIIIRGDVNGDGKISAVDYVKIKNYIMGSSSLSGSFKQAADANGDGKISAVDYVNIKNYIMGRSNTLK